jgi:hypothetical protein
VLARRPPGEQILVEVVLPRRIIAIGAAALATAGSGLAAVAMAAAPAAANAGCTTNLESATFSNVNAGGPGVEVDGRYIIIDRGTPLETTGDELADGEAWLSCVVANPAGVL